MALPGFQHVDQPIQQVGLPRKLPQFADFARGLWVIQRVDPVPAGQIVIVVQGHRAFAAMHKAAKTKHWHDVIKA